MESEETNGIYYNQRGKNNISFQICIAEKNIEISCSCSKVYYECKDYLTQNQMPDFSIHIEENDYNTEAKKIIPSAFNVDINNVAIHPDLCALESWIIYKKIANRMITFNTVMVHGAAVAVDNHSYIFMAPSGTGKTTHVCNWKKVIPDSQIINGDKPLVNLDKLLVYGTPWCGKEQQNINTCVPLSALIWLERGNANTINRINFMEMLPNLIRQCYIPKEPDLAIKMYRLLDRFKDTPCFKMTCNMNAESAIMAYNVLNHFNYVL